MARPGYLFAFLFAVLPQTASARDRLDDLILRQMTLSRLPGVAVAVVERGRPVAVRTYGAANLEWNAPVTRDTSFQLGPATKIVTGILLMRLVEDGRLSLDDPLTRWFPEAPRTWADIRVGQLANHTSSLSEDLKVEGPRSVAAIVAAAENAPLAYPPGTEARYGFTDFTVLRAVLEKAGSKPLPDLIRDRIVAPLGLRSTRFADAEEDGPVRLGDVIPHRPTTYGIRAGRLATADFFFEPAGYGAGGLYSSIDDLATVFAAVDRGVLLRPESLRALETPARLQGGGSGGFGVGWIARVYRGVPVVGHSGGPALADIPRIEDRQLTVIVLTNQQTFYPVLAEQVLDLYLRDAADPPVRRDGHPAVAVRLAAILSGHPLPSEAPVAAPLASPFERALLRAVGEVRRVEFLGEDNGKACRTTRTYRVRSRWKTMVWKVDAGCRDEVLDLRPA